MSKEAENRPAVGAVLARAARARWLRWGLIAAVYVAAFLAVNHKLWGGKRYFGWDAVGEHWGAITYGSTYIKTGSLPLWCPHQRGGYPFLADPQSGALYPVNLPFYLGVLALGNNMWWILIHLLVHVAIAAVGTHYALQRLKLPPAARWLGGMAFILSARFLKAKDTSWIWAAAWLPWIYVAADEVARRPTRKAGVLLGLACGLCFTSGYTPNFFRNIVAVAPVLIVVAWVASRDVADRRVFLRRLLRSLGIAALICAGLALPIVLATLDILPLTIRNVDMGDVLDSTIRPFDAVGLVVPGSFGASFGYPYFGLMGVLLAALACSLRYERRRVLFALIAAGFFLLACGGHTFVLPALAQAVSVFKLWRIPSNYLFVTNFFLALLAALGLADLLQATPEDRERLRRRGLALAAAALVVALTLVLAWPEKGGWRHAPRTAVVLAGLCALFMLWLGSADARVRGKAAWLVVVLLVLDTGVQLKPVINILGRKPNLGPDAKLHLLQGVARDARLFDDLHFKYRVGMRHEIRQFNGDTNLLALKRWHDYYERSVKNPALMAAANVRYHAGRNTDLVRRKAGAGAKALDRRITELTEHAPFAYWTDRVRVLDAERKVLDAMARGEGEDRAIFVAHDLHLATEARLQPLRERGDGGPKPEGGWSIAGEVVALGQNSLTLAIEAPRPGVVVIQETFAPGWRATVDGRPAEVVPVNYTFRGLLVGAGKHRIEMVYRPTGALIGLAVYGLTVLALLGLGGRALLRRRRAGGRTSPGGGDEAA